MPLTTALYTGLSGLTVNQVALDVIGNNIANVNTYAFKSSRALFEPQFSETTTFGTAPGAVLGGSNPIQKGLGANLSTIQRNFTSGNIKPTQKGDLAIEGQGLFVVDGVERGYTRNGSFETNSEDYLVTSDGRYVMGYGVDNEFNIIPGQLERVRIPIGSLTIAQATSRVAMKGILEPDGDLATAGTMLQSQAIKLNDGGAGGAVVGSTALVDLLNSADQTMFADGDTLTFIGRRGGAIQSERTLTVDATTTVDDLLTLMVDAIGINTDPDIPHPAGASIVDQGGGEYVLQVAGNVGTANRLEFITGDLQTDSNTPMPTFTIVQDAVGESVSTSATVFDSLGNALNLGITYVYESQDNSGTTWRFFLTSADDTDQSSVVGTGTARFDTSGNFIAATNATATIDRQSTGSQTPLAITINMNGINACAKNPESSVSVNSADGFQGGTLTRYGVGKDGVISGLFDNGLTRTLGQLAVATFSSYGGLIDTGNNVFRSGPNSGVAVIGTPLTGGAGKIVDGALETSNVDISNEFINLITTSAGFSASSRIVTTANQLLTELLAIMR